MSNQPFPDIPDVISINGNKVVVRKYFEAFRGKKHKSVLQQANERNLTDNTCKGLVNRKIRLKMRSIITNWIEALKLSPVNEKGYKIYMPTFITLTLSAKQFHADKELHAKGLNRFIQTIKRQYKVENYLWRAERQGNGNIHYHIIVDRYIHYKAINQIWNTIQKDLGYIDKYRKEQQHRHQTGFNFIQTKNEKWTREKQYNAYTHGIATNWQNPNSTDIHSLANIENVSDYICKYATKSDEYDDLQRLKKSYAEQQISEELFQQYKEDIKVKIEANKINGRVWGCSDGLKEIKDPKIIVTYQESLFIEELTKDKTSKIISDENYCIIYNRNIKKHINNNTRIKEQLNEHHKSNLYYLYPEFKPYRKQTQQQTTQQTTITQRQKQLELEWF